MTDYIKKQVRTATMQAMDARRIFSWAVEPRMCCSNKTDVQCGVYVSYSQEHWQKYRAA